MKHTDAFLIHFLQRYLQINTSHPYPDYASVCNFFKNQAKKDNLECTIITVSNNKPVIIITMPGTDPHMPGLILNHHMDVVPALNYEEWIMPPFEGAIYENKIIGRGIQDCKGLGAIQYCALKELKRKNIPFKRNTYLCIVPDEEIGGFSGTKEFIKTDFFNSMNAQFILDEGVPSGKKDILAIKISERKPLQVQLTTKGFLAHGSKLHCFNAIHELISLLQKFINLHEVEQRKSSSIADGLLISSNITSLLAGVYQQNKTSVNIVPDYATATIDIRVPPTIATDVMLNNIETIVKGFPHSSYTILAGVFDDAQLISEETVLYKALTTNIQECGLSSEPHFFEASSDLRFYKELGFDGLGFSPFTCQDNMHGTNESLPIPDLLQGQRIMTHFLQTFCC